MQGNISFLRNRQLAAVAEVRFFPNDQTPARHGDLSLIFYFSSIYVYHSPIRNRDRASISLQIGMILRRITCRPINKRILTDNEIIYRGTAATDIDCGTIPLCYDILPCGRTSCQIDGPLIFRPIRFRDLTGPCAGINLGANCRQCTALRIKTSIATSNRHTGHLKRRTIINTHTRITSLCYILMRIRRTYPDTSGFISLYAKHPPLI